MTQASSTNSDSASSAIASLIMTAVHAPDIVKSGVVRKRQARKMSRLFRKEARRIAKEYEGWSDIAKYIDVGVRTNTVKLYVNGPADVQRQAEMLEFGGVDIAPTPILRALEARFTEDVIMSMGGYR